MKTIGLIGGMSWESTLPYYRIINERVRARLGGLHSARCVLWSFDFHEIEQLQRRDDWRAATAQMIAAGRALARAGADFLVICTNTMHLMAEQVRQAAGLPLLHIADATAAAIRQAGLETVGLLATRFTMEKDFYVGRLREQHAIEVLVPEPGGRQRVHEIIYGELCRGQIGERSRRELGAIIQRLAAAGAQGVVLGCTELGLLLRPEDSPLPLFDTARIHAEAAADFALRAE